MNPAVWLIVSIAATAVVIGCLARLSGWFGPEPQHAASRHDAAGHAMDQGYQPSPAAYERMRGQPGDVPGLHAGHWAGTRWMQPDETMLVPRTSPPSEPMPLLSPPRVTAHREPRALDDTGWDLPNLVIDQLDGLSPGQYVDLYFGPLERRVARHA